MAELRRKPYDEQIFREALDLPTVLLQEARSGKTGRLRIMGPYEQHVDLYFETGRVFQVAYNGRPARHAEEILAAMLRWAHWSPWFSAGLQPPLSLVDRRYRSMRGLLQRAAKNG